MTTGRINQVTIVRRRDRPTARFTGQKRSLVTVVSELESPRGGAARPAGRQAGRSAPSAFPFRIPQSAVGWREGGAEERPEHAAYAAPRGGPARGSGDRFASPASRYPRKLSEGLAISQTPTEPSLRRWRALTPTTPQGPPPQSTAVLGRRVLLTAEPRQTVGSYARAALHLQDRTRPIQGQGARGGSRKSTTHPPLGPPPRPLRRRLTTVRSLIARKPPATVGPSPWVFIRRSRTLIA